MGRALELLSGFVTAPDTTLTALTMASGNSLTIRNAAPGSDVFLLQAFATNQSAGVLRIRSPQMHDNVQGIRLRVTADDAEALLPFAAHQKLMPQDTLAVELSGSATGGDIEQAHLLLYYEDLPGVSAHLIDHNELMSRFRNLLTVENTLSSGTSGGYSGEEALNAEFDLLQANQEYALVGYHVSAQCGAIRWRGVDTGNLGVGGPGNAADKGMTGSWFMKLSQALGRPTIPVFNSANAAGILLDCTQDEDGADPVVTTILAQLA